MDDRSTSGGTSFLDEDIDFDMLLDDEPEVEQRGPRMLKARSKRRYKPARLRSAPNWSRIGAALFVAVVFLFVVGFAVSSYLGHRKAEAYKTYFSDVRDVLGQSDGTGKEIDDLLSQPSGADRAQLIGRIDKLAVRSQTYVRDARKLTPPDEMQGTHAWLVTALEYRTNCLVSLERAMTAALRAPRAAAAAPAVASANARCIASDVVIADSYGVNARKVLRQEGVSGVTVPTSQFVTDPEYGSVKAMANALARITAATPGKGGAKPATVNDGKTHGGQIGDTVVSPSGQTLSTQTLNEIPASAELALEINYQNQGDVQEAQIPVTVLLKGENSEPQQFDALLDKVDPDTTATVKVPLADVPTFGEQQQLCIEFGAVPGEKITSNNSVCYAVAFRQ